MSVFVLGRHDVCCRQRGDFRSDFMIAIRLIDPCWVEPTHSFERHGDGATLASRTVRVPFFATPDTGGITK